MKIKRLNGILVPIVALAGIALTTQAFMSPMTPETKIEAIGKKTVFVKTSYRCSKCSCTGYWGYKHPNGRYEGACSNRDKGGHTCGHSPEKHGLKSW